MSRSFSVSDTIVAIATPPGRGGIGVVRLSGPEAVTIAAALVDRDEPLVARHATFTRVVDRGSVQGPLVDQVVVTWFAQPHSYTGEDVVEISGHGSPLLLRRIVELAMAAGARLAEPGEFTLRAYLSGRIDLAQAEAVADLVDAVTPLQARAAMDQLEGTLTETITRIDAQLFDLAARLEASLDFPDEGFHFVTRDQAAVDLRLVADALDRLAADGRAGRVVREGRMVVIVGRPNAGKSSLFNALVGSARAIVTEVPGTTRDLLTERVEIGGVPITLVDTAGLRDASDVIEAEGVDRARRAQEVAALSVVVVDGSTPMSEDDRRLIGDQTAARIVVFSKSDLPRSWDPARALDNVSFVPVSAFTGEGLDALRAAIVAALIEREELRDTPAISNVRHLALVETARAAVGAAIAALSAGVTEELVLTDLAAARHALEEITGARTADDLLEHIFRKFCVGK